MLFRSVDNGRYVRFTDTTNSNLNNNAFVISNVIHGDGNVTNTLSGYANIGTPVQIETSNVTSNTTIVYIDEVDKISNTEHGRELTGILTHITDLTQNDTFNDKYFSGIDIDLSKALIIFSYNDSNLIDPILRDRITEIRINPLVTKDKIAIVKDFLLPEILDNLGYKKHDINVLDEDIIHLIDSYTYEAGVRKLKEKIIEVLRIINLERLYGEDIQMPYNVSKNKIEEILSNKPKIIFKKIAKNPGVG